MTAPRCQPTTEEAALADEAHRKFGLCGYIEFGPATAPTIIAALRSHASLTARVAELEAALQFYARHCHDDGRKARAALDNAAGGRG